MRHHYSVVVRTFASGAEVPLAARVRAPVGADVGATLTILQNIVHISEIVPSLGSAQCSVGSGSRRWLRLRALAPALTPAPAPSVKVKLTLQNPKPYALAILFSLNLYESNG